MRRTNDASIFSTSNDRRLSDDRFEYPVPKSSKAIPNPSRLSSSKVFATASLSSAVRSVASRFTCCGRIVPSWK